ncbi:MAG: sodium:solute symporter family protein, partial [ANME-2 cluster archaeon]|nr:sodium:solute symporter family protein [ANME-2 cluster archaeon]
VTPSGPDSVYRLTHADMLSCVSISRGSNADEIWMAAEPRVESVKALKKEFFTAYGEVVSVLEQMNIRLVISEPKS